MTEKAKTLRRLLKSGDYFVAPGVFDLFSARVADRAGFPALYMSGFGISLSLLGQPDAGLATYSDFVERVRRIGERTAVPLIADADTGFGGLLNVREVVRGYEAAGAAAIQIEDQVFPKRCGHTVNKRVVPAEDMVAKIRVAVDSRLSSDFVIIARTDARGVNGFDDAMRRGEAYAAAGADVLFIEAPETEAELAAIGRGFDVPVMANMNPGPTRTPELPADRLAELGFAFSIYPGVTMMAAAAAMTGAFGHLRKAGSMIGYDGGLSTLAELTDIAGFPDVWEFGRRYDEAQVQPASDPAASGPRPPG